jgi:hypothetical protein
MTAKNLRLNMRETIQTILDGSIGENKSRATENGRVLYLYEETYHGCNEIEIGTWRFDKGGVFIYVHSDYEEGREILKNRLRPKNFPVITLSNLRK